MTARLGLLTGLLSALAWASDPPHDSSQDITCNSCHASHVEGIGVAITKTVGNYNLCKSCHDGLGPTFAWPATHQALPGGQGRSHRWDAPAVNAAHGAATPVNAEVLKHLSSGNLQCSTCHEQHTGATASGGRQRVSVAVASALPHSGGTGTGTMTLSQPAAAAMAKGYRVQIVTAGSATTATFRVSNDNGISWFGWSGAWAPGVGTGRTASTLPLDLNDGTNVQVAFTGTFQVGDFWSFYVSYPLLQMSMTNSELCETCHGARVQSAAYVESGGDGTKVFSHPVGEQLAKSYDRAPAALLDANGQPQSTGDGIVSNDLALDSANKVRCLSCHGVHNVDSNSLTEDPR